MEFATLQWVNSKLAMKYLLLVLQLSCLLDHLALAEFFLAEVKHSSSEVASKQLVRIPNSFAHGKASEAGSLSDKQAIGGDYTGNFPSYNSGEGSLEGNGTESLDTGNFPSYNSGEGPVEGNETESLDITKGEFFHPSTIISFKTMCP